MEEMTTQQVADMVYTMLKNRLEYLVAPRQLIVADDVWCVERANNIAAALSGLTIK